MVPSTGVKLSSATIPFAAPAGFSKTTTREFTGASPWKLIFPEIADPVAVGVGEEMGTICQVGAAVGEAVMDVGVSVGVGIVVGVADGEAIPILKCAEVTFVVAVSHWGVNARALGAAVDA